VAGKEMVEHPLTDKAERIAESLDLIGRQLDAGLKLMLKESQGERKTIDMIRLLGGMGCRAADIANWLRAPLTSVAPILSRMNVEKPSKKSSKKPTKKRRR